MSGDVETTIATLRDAATVMRSVTVPITDELRAIDAAIQALQAAKCERLAEMDAAKAHEADGASSISTWARRELHQDAARTRQMVRAAATFRDLPAVGAAAHSSEIGLEHVFAFTFALKHIGIEEAQQLEEPLLELAKAVAPAELFAKIRSIRDVLHAEACLTRPGSPAWPGATSASRGVVTAGT